MCNSKTDNISDMGKCRDILVEKSYSQIDFCLFMEQIINCFLKCFCSYNDLIIQEEKKHPIIVNPVK